MNVLGKRLKYLRDKNNYLKKIHIDLKKIIETIKKEQKSTTEKKRA